MSSFVTILKSSKRHFSVCVNSNSFYFFYSLSKGIVMKYSFIRDAVGSYDDASSCFAVSSYGKVLFTVYYDLSTLTWSIVTSD